MNIYDLWSIIKHWITLPAYNWTWEDKVVIKEGMKVMHLGTEGKYQSIRILQDIIAKRIVFTKKIGSRQLSSLNKHDVLDINSHYCPVAEYT